MIFSRRKNYLQRVTSVISDSIRVIISVYDFRLERLHTTRQLHRYLKRKWDSFKEKSTMFRNATRCKIKITLQLNELRIASV